MHRQIDRQKRNTEAKDIKHKGVTKKDTQTRKDTWKQTDKQKVITYIFRKKNFLRIVRLYQFSKKSYYK